MEVKERQFALPGLTLAAREWGSPDGVPVLATHGWLDNAGSFDMLAPRLDGCHTIAVDAAGHGLSGNRSPDASYNLLDEVDDLLGVADELGWQRFSLLGHSRGAAVATLLAGAFPDRIERMVLLEGGIPILGEAGDAPVHLARALTERRELRSRSGRVFADRQTALEQRANGFSPVQLGTAEVLANRSLREVDGGFRWHADQRLKAHSEIRLTVPQFEAFVARVAAPVLVFLASESPFANAPDYRRMLAGFAQVELVELAGGHHFHLEGAETRIGAEASRFLRRDA